MGPEPRLPAAIAPTGHRIFSTFADPRAAMPRDAQGSELASFASGIVDDEDAVRAAVVELWSNGQTEGQVIELKLVRRQMYGRGKIDLLQARTVQPE